MNNQTDNHEQTELEEVSLDSSAETAAAEPTAPQEPNYKDMYLRAQANNLNEIKQIQKQSQESVKFGNAKILQDLISILNTFEIALSYSPTDQGILMLQKQFLDVLTKHNLVMIEPNPGDKLDPNKHKAIDTVKSDDYADGSIDSVRQKGYMLHDRVLTPAQVVVVKNQ